MAGSVPWSEPRFPHCGNINPLGADEVVVLQPGEVFEFKVFAPRTASREACDASLSFANDPAAEWQGIQMGRHDAGALRAVRASTAFSVVSAPVRIGAR